MSAPSEERWKDIATRHLARLGAVILGMIEREQEESQRGLLCAMLLEILRELEGRK